MSDSCCDGNARKAQAGDCCAPDGNVMLLSCSGGSNVGQLANQACVELTQEGFGKIFCLAGIGGKLSGFVRSAKDVPRMVVLDGCEVGCAKAIFKEAGTLLRGYVVLTDLGISKNKDFARKREDIDQVKAAAKQASQAQV
ncbi:MAG: zinc-binding protein [Desulfarculus sp.]|jgi:uncharacterized metal-binding protein|nr:MAG: zinc-binding protein [Desulfarculus sp.]